MIGIVGSGRDVTKEKQIESALQESQNRFATFMGHFPGAAFMCDENLHLIYVNAYMQRVLGDLARIGQPLHALFAEGRPDKITMDCLRTLTEGLQESNEVLLDVNGRQRTYRMLKFPVYKAGKSTILGGIGIDITQRVEAENALKKAYADQR
jgi:PAS domain S-box-containing protein